MTDYAGLDANELEKLLFTIEASLKISKRYQFFLWAQGSLQSFIPHETLVCAYGDVGNLSYRYECFSRDVLPLAIERSLGDPAFGMLPRIVDSWLIAGRQPMVFGPSGTELARHGFANVLGHGAPEIQGANGSFFVFLRMPHEPTARDAHLANLLMPYLHMALYRMLAKEAEAGGVSSGEPGSAAMLSRREMQVLEWVRNGKTNPEIGQILSISPLTVKNHVQKILRKLNVTNRAQAVGKGVSHRMFPDRPRESRAHGDVGDLGEGG